MKKVDMKKRKLISMVQFVNELTSMNTKDFCNEYGYNYPTTEWEVDAYILNEVKKYAKILNEPLRLDMFIGENSLFLNFEKTKDFENKPIVRQKGETQVYVELENGLFSMKYPRMADRVEDMLESHTALFIYSSWALQK